ncbi:Polyphenol oxidase II, chloroplastic [Sesamum alatum]|uniref:Polyphenol oxidase II, chloroplastic n=1 Tax=Sesamum alatum TaxID=300844 RepID=A0AAE1YQE7_9LAMI|nr:Polyphenol oxidase II, chloroplastic [Sesamum alatum]
MSSSLPCSWATPILPSSSSYSSSQVLYSNPTARRTPNLNGGFRATQKTDNQNMKSSHDSQGSNKFDRRDMLIGLGGLYGAASSINPLNASAAPIPPPDLNACRTATNINNGQPVPYSCCPPVNNRIVDFRLPARPTIRTRPAAHLVNAQYISRFNLAMQRMINLPASDPRSFMQQANVHCAYCNGAYTYPSATGSQRLEIQVHNCWLFFPFHRWYLYFFERILGSLINDPTFAMPYWNWDSPAGMYTPNMYLNQRQYPALFNTRRNQRNMTLPADLGYSGTNNNLNPTQTAANNCAIMHNEIIRNANTLQNFMGRIYRRGDAINPGAGTHEAGSHTAIHIWGGDPRQPSGEDLGNFYSAGRDPLFYAHHANVDRMWTLWRNRRGNQPRDFTDPDYLNAQFLFYDENRQLVRVRADSRVNVPWIQCPPQPRVKGTRVGKMVEAPKLETVEFPLKLDKIVKILVPRPKKSRSKEEKDKEQEVLLISDIEVDTEKVVKFDVFVDEEENDYVNLAKAEYTGTFAQVPHKHETPLQVKTSRYLELTQQLEDLGVEDDDEILVTLVPRAGDITIGSIKIIYDPSD